MQIILNGKKEQVNDDITIEGLLGNMELPRYFVVEHNKNIIYKENYALTALNEGDEVEVASFCGGG